MNAKKFAQRAIIPLIIVLGTLLLLLMFMPGLRPVPKSATSTVSGAAAIGGAFTLTDQKNQTVTADSLKGRHLLVYFGFTHCPDICPISLQTMTQALEIAGPLGEGVIPVFITVDAERDTPAAMADYIANFHPRFLALTGTADQLRAAADAYRVYFKKAQEQSPGEYMMEHSGFIYFMDGQGQYVTHFNAESTPEEIAARIRVEFGPKR
ncbi:MAG: SCO family protein [Rhodospirillaceae bacterium]|nr:SCO family protein [Rhodospirillaceae bacterium]